MSQTALATQARNAVIATINTAFAAEIAAGWVVLPGRLHTAYPGLQQGPPGAFGVFPRSESEGRRVLDQDTIVMVQLFLDWPRGRLDPKVVIDPTVLEGYAERLREAHYTAGATFVGTGSFWDWRVARIDFLEDPTGQVTRFEATIKAIGQNYAETHA